MSPIPVSRLTEAAASLANQHAMKPSSVSGEQADVTASSLGGCHDPTVAYIAVFSDGFSRCVDHAVRVSEPASP